MFKPEMPAILWHLCIIIAHIAILTSITIVAFTSPGTSVQQQQQQRIKTRNLRQNIHWISQAHAAPETDSSSYDNESPAYLTDNDRDLLDDQAVKMMQRAPKRRYVSNSVHPKQDSKQVQAKSKQFSDNDHDHDQHMYIKSAVFHNGADSGTHTALGSGDWGEEEEDKSLSTSVNLHTVFDTKPKPPRGSPKFRTAFRKATTSGLKQEGTAEGFRVPLTFPTIKMLVQPLIKADVISYDTAQDIWERIKQNYITKPGSFPSKTQLETKLIILEQIEDFIVKHFSAVARIGDGENLTVAPYSKQYLLAVKHIDLFIDETDMFGDFDQHHNEITDETKIAFVHYYLFCQYVSKIASVPPPAHYRAMYVKAVSSETRSFNITVYTNKQSIKDSVRDFASGMVQLLVKLSEFSFHSPYVISYIEVCQAWWKRELEIKTDVITVYWKTLDFLQKTLQAIEDVHLQQDVRTRKNHYTSMIIQNTSIYSKDKPLPGDVLDQYNEFNLCIDFELLKRHQTYPIELNLWKKLVHMRQTTLEHTIWKYEKNQSNASAVVDHLSIHVLFEHAKQDLQTTTEITNVDERIAILNDIMKVCDREFSFLEEFEIETTSCHDMLKQTTVNVIEMTTEVHEIMNDIESIAHDVDLGCQTSITPYLRIISFFVRKLSLSQKSNQMSFPIKKHIVQEAFNLLSTGNKHRIDVLKDSKKCFQDYINSLLVFSQH